MQKQGSRMLLLTITVLALVGGVIWNAVNIAKATSAESGHEGHNHGSGEGATADERAEAQQRLRGTLAVKEAPAPGTEAADAGIPERPTILVEQHSINKPRPNDSSTATHWYRDSSRPAMLSEQNRREREGG